MKHVKLWCGRAAAGTETAAMNPMVEAQGDADEGTHYVLASDYDALLREYDALLRNVKGTDFARMLGPEHAAHADAIEAMLQQLLIALVKREGGMLSMPVQEIDDTGGHTLSFRIDENRVFHFETRAKQ